DSPRLPGLAQLCGSCRARQIICAALRAQLFPLAPGALLSCAAERAHSLAPPSAPVFGLPVLSEARPNCAQLSRQPPWQVVDADRILSVRIPRSVAFAFAVRCRD